MTSKIQVLTFTILLIALAGCQTNGDLLRSPYYSLAYTRGDALLAANGHPIKVNLVTDHNRADLEKYVSGGLNKHGPKWLNARYSPQSSIDDSSPYQMKWAFNVPENGNALSLCKSDYLNQKQPETESKTKTGVVLAAFCLHNRTLTSLRARFQSEPGTEDFAQSIGLIGRQLLSATNPERMDDCKNFDDCS